MGQAVLCPLMQGAVQVQTVGLVLKSLCVGFNAGSFHVAVSGSHLHRSLECNMVPPLWKAVHELWLFSVVNSARTGSLDNQDQEMYGGQTSSEAKAAARVVMQSQD